MMDEIFTYVRTHPQVIVLVFYLAYRVYSGYFAKPQTIEGSRVVQVNSTEQLEEELASKEIAVVDFYADWCPPCKTAAPEFAIMSKNLTSINFLKVNVDAAKDVAKLHEIKSMPTFKIFVKGKMVQQFTGFNKSQILSKLNELSRNK